MWWKGRCDSSFHGLSPSERDCRKLKVDDQTAPSYFHPISRPSREKLKNCMSGLFVNYGYYLTQDKSTASDGLFAHGKEKLHFTLFLTKTLWTLDNANIFSPTWWETLTCVRMVGDPKSNFADESKTEIITNIFWCYFIYQVDCFACIFVEAPHIKLGCSKPLMYYVINILPHLCNHISGLTMRLKM